jgi:hypothetical protein
MVMHFWPRNTLRAAYRQWQALENRLAEAKQRLDRQYLALRRQAEEVRTEAHQGILRAARLMLDQPVDPMTLMVQGRLQKAFALLGKGFCRRLPSILEIELARYAARVEHICRSHDGLGARLEVAQEIIRIFQRNPEFCRVRFFRLAIISPESAWLLFHLRQKRLRDRQALQACLASSCQPRLE